jgi:hypothetical protein
MGVGACSVVADRYSCSFVRRSEELMAAPEPLVTEVAPDIYRIEVSNISVLDLQRLRLLQAAEKTHLSNGGKGRGPSSLSVLICD